MLIDEDGNLFGVLNVVDLAVVVSLLALLIFAVGLTTLSTERVDTTTTNVTVKVVDQEYVVDQIAVGDTFSKMTTDAEFTVVDKYSTPDGGQEAAFLRLSLVGEQSGSLAAYDGVPPRIGRNITLQTNRYETLGTIITVGGGDRLNTSQQTVALRSTLSPEDSRSLEPGTTIRADGQTIGTINNITRYENAEQSGHLVYINSTLLTFDDRNGHRFGDTVLETGSNVKIPFSSGEYTVSVMQVDETFVENTTDVVVKSTMAADVALSIDRGDTYRLGNDRLGTVESVTTFGTDEAGVKEVYVGVSLQTTTIDDTIWYGETPVRQENVIRLGVSGESYDAQITRVGTTERVGTPVTREVTLTLTDIPPSLADDITEGMTERSGETTLAQITDVERSNATIVLTDDSGNIYEREHPIRDDLTITATLQMREKPAGITFKDRLIQRGDQITLALEDRTIRPTVRSIQPTDG